MCIALVCPEGARPPKKVLQKCFENNPDGAGYAFPSKSGVVIRKGFYTFRSFWRDYRTFAPKHSTILIHFRIATSGQIDGENCHPFRVTKNLAMIHNGNLAGKIGLDCSQLSDTALFVANILLPIVEQSKNVWRTEPFKYLMQEATGITNKCALLDESGHYAIFNEKQGEWKDGVWFSNKSFGDDKVFRPTATAGVCKFNDGNALKVATLSFKKDVIHKKPSLLFWKKKESLDKISTKRQAFYKTQSERHGAQLSPQTVMNNPANETPENLSLGQRNLGLFL